MFTFNSMRTLRRALLLCAVCISSSRAQLPTIAITPLEPSGVSLSEAKIITNRLNSELFQIGRFTIVEQARVYNLLNEKGYRQPEDCTTTECVTEIGRLLKVQYMIAGNVGRIGQTFVLDTRTVEVTSGHIVQTTTNNFVGQIDDMLGIVKETAMRLSKIEIDEAVKSLSQVQRKSGISEDIQDLSLQKIRYHVGGSYFIGITSNDNYMPLGIRFFYHLNRQTFGLFFGRVIDYGYEFVDTNGGSVDLLFHNMIFAEVSFDHMLSSKKPISAFAGISMAYTNPIRSEYSRQTEPPYDSIVHNRRKSKIGVHPQVGVYLQRNYPVSARIAGSYAIFLPESEGIDLSGLTFEGALMLSC